MEFSGRCYCGKIRYQVAGNPVIKLQCHCRECQYISGGSVNVTIGMPAAGFKYTQGTPKAFTRKDLKNGVTREFCADCGTQLLTRAPHALPDVMLIKVGTMDDPKQFSPDIALFTAEAQPFHHIAAGIKPFEGMPG